MEDILAKYLDAIEGLSFSYLYLISEGSEGPIKVGISNNPASRLSCLLQTGNPRPLKILATYRFLASQVSEVETMFHFDFADKVIFGEWLDISERLLLDCMADFFESNGYEVIP